MRRHTKRRTIRGGLSIKGSFSGLKGKFGNTKKFLSSSSASKSSTGALSGILGQTFKNKTQKVGNLAKTALNAGVGNTQQILSTTIPTLGNMGALPGGVPQAQIVPPPSAPQNQIAPPPSVSANIPLAQYTNISIPPYQSVEPSAPPMNMPQAQVNFPNLRKKYKNIEAFYKASDDAFYPANNLRKYGPKMNNTTKKNNSKPQNGGRRRTRV